MKKAIFLRKSVVFFIGLSFLVTAAGFGSSTDPCEKNLMWETGQDRFSLVEKETAGLQWNSRAFEEADSFNLAAPLEIVHPKGIDTDKEWSGEESGVADSRTERGKLAITIRAGSASITTGGYGSSFTYGLGLYMYLSERIGLEISLDRYSVPVSKDFEGMGMGKLQVTPLLLSGHWRFPMGRFVPYAAVGAGFYFIHFQPDPKEEQSTAQDLVYADRFALHFGGGVDVQITNSLDFLADLRYSLIKTWIQERDAHHVYPEEQNLFKLNTLVLALGIRYYF